MSEVGPAVEQHEEGKKGLRGEEEEDIYDDARPLIVWDEEQGRYLPTFALSPPFDSPPQFSDNGYEYEYCRRVYGSQVLEAPKQSSCELVEETKTISSTSIYKKLRMNVWVTSGFTPGGFESGYSDVSLVKAAERERERLSHLDMDVDERESSTGTCASARLKSKVKDVLMAASTTATQIRAAQRFRDGNHRTAILTFILQLSESGWTISLPSSSRAKSKKTFDLMILYYLISAREHPSNNESNSLDEEGIAETSLKTFRYSRKRINSSSSISIHYFQEVFQLVRQLPVYVSFVEEEFIRLKSLQRRERWDRWMKLDPIIQKYLKFAHENFVGLLIRQKPRP